VHYDVAGDVVFYCEVIWEVTSNPSHSQAGGTHAICIVLLCEHLESWHGQQSNSMYTSQFPPISPQVTATVLSVHWVKIPCENYTLKWVYTCDIYVKNDEKDSSINFRTLTVPSKKIFI
jgi:hypothetical protein